MTSFRPCIVIPTFDNAGTIERVVERAHAELPHVIVVDDGSGLEAQLCIRDLEARGLASVERRPRNGGKGAAVKTGLQAAHARGYTHAVQVDADGQHDLEDLTRFIAAARDAPRCLILGRPSFDTSIPAARRYGRLISVFWSAIESLGGGVGDPLCGFRVYPVAEALAVNARGERMDFDPEIAVRLVWAGTRVVHVDTAVRYLSEDEGGVSHFEPLWDNVRISLMHTRLVIEALLRAPLILARRLRPALPEVAPAHDEPAE